MGAGRQEAGRKWREERGGKKELAGRNWREERGGKKEVGRQGRNGGKKRNPELGHLIFSPGWWVQPGLKAERQRREEGVGGKTEAGRGIFK